MRYDKAVEQLAILTSAVPSDTATSLTYDGHGYYGVVITNAFGTATLWTVEVCEDYLACLVRS